MPRLLLNARESAFYHSLYTLAQPDQSGYVSGAKAAELLQYSGLSRDFLHRIWSIADVRQEGRLDLDSFFVVLRLVAHAQSGQSPDISLLNLEPQSLPIFEGLTRRRDIDVLSVSDMGGGVGAPGLGRPVSVAGAAANVFGAPMDVSQAADLSVSLQRLGLDPLSFTPFGSSPVLPASSAHHLDLNNWKISESEREKYSFLFQKLDTSNTGLLDGKTAREVLQRAKLSTEILSEIWDLCDIGRDGKLNEGEFICAMHIATLVKGSRGTLEVPFEIPAELKKILINTTNSMSEEVKRVPEKMEDIPMRANFNTMGNEPMNKMQGSLMSASMLGGSVSPVRANMFIDEEGSEKDKAIIKDLTREIDDFEEETRCMKNMAESLEEGNSRASEDVGRKKALIVELERQLVEYQDQLRILAERRRSVNLQKVSRKRDKDQLLAEKIYLQRAIEDIENDMQDTSSSNKSLQTHVDDAIRVVQSMERIRVDVSNQVRLEQDRVRDDQIETSKLMGEYDNTRRENVAKESLDAVINQRREAFNQLQGGGSPRTKNEEEYKSRGWANDILGKNVNVGSSDSNVRGGRGSRLGSQPSNTSHFKSNFFPADKAR